MSIWIPTHKALPAKDGWYLVTWAHPSGDADPSIDYSAYSVGHWFEDRWGSNSIALAWMEAPMAYKP